MCKITFPARYFLQLVVKEADHGKKNIITMVDSDSVSTYQEPPKTEEMQRCGIGTHREQTTPEHTLERCRSTVQLTSGLVDAAQDCIR